MNYELCKELKEAGFQSNGNAWNDTLKEVLPVPTLSELIEACGEDFARLSFVAVDGPEWEATGAPPGIELMRKIGRTPNEAVARLWLALQVDNPSTSPIR